MADGRTSPAVAETLAVLLPTADESALLATCLHAGEAARDGWRRWRAARSPSEDVVRRDLVAHRTLLPLLARSVRENALDVPRGVLPYLRAATLREELRAARYDAIAAESLGALAAAGTSPVVVGGAALAVSAYATRALRHCHDLDLLVPADELATVVATLERVACTPVAALPERPSDALLRHDSGLEIALHTRPFAVRYYAASFEHLTAPRRVVAIAGASAATLAPEAALVHRIGHATYSSSRAALHWVADAWHLVARHTELDWTEVRARIEAYRLALPASVLLAWLARFGVPVPADLPAALARRAAAGDRAAADVALGGALAGSRGRVRVLWRATPSWRGRRRLLRWAALPSLAYLQSRYPDASLGSVAAAYLTRPARFVLGALRRPEATCRR